MAGFSRGARTIGWLVALLFATSGIVAAVMHYNGIDLFSAGVSAPSPALQGGAPASAASAPQTTQAAPEGARTESLPWLSPSQTLPLVNGSRFFPPSFTAPGEALPPSAVVTGDAKETGGSGEQSSEVLPSPAGPDHVSPVPFTPERNAAGSPSRDERLEKSDVSPHVSMTIYGTATAANDSGSSVRGEIPPHQLPLGPAESFGLPDSSSGKEGEFRASPRGEDSVVGLATIQDLARFLADNYWPAGTHPRARRRGISTASVKWANVMFGGQLQGFNVNHANPVQERSRVLNYLFMPSMIKGLYELYNDRFFTALEKEALSQRRGPENRPLNQYEVAELYELYGTMAKGLAGTVRAYVSAPDTATLARAYADAAQRAEEANQRVLTAGHANSPGRASLAKQYRTAVTRREEQRDSLVAALRRSGAPRGLDPDAMAYTALWLYRRGSNIQAAAGALADVLDACADGLEQKSVRITMDKRGRGTRGK